MFVALWLQDSFFTSGIVLAFQKRKKGKDKTVVLNWG
jgi:hypothetical protein